MICDVMDDESTLRGYLLAECQRFESPRQVEGRSVSVRWCGAAEVQDVIFCGVTIRWVPTPDEEFVLYTANVRK
jgi:hypothetical protein